MKFFFLIPQINETGPVRGMLALAKELENQNFEVVIVCLNYSKFNFDKKVDVYQLKTHSLMQKYYELKSLVHKNNNGVFVSMNFKTDLLLSMIRGAKRFQYIRGDLFSNYYYSYGLVGVVLAKINYRLSKYFTATLVLNEKIFSHVKCQKNVKIIGNLIDESQLVQYQAETISNKDKAMTKFIFVGSIDQRKRPDLLISAAIYLKSRKVNFELFILGDGPMMHSVEAMVKKNNLTNSVKIYGHVKNPFELMAQCDVFVLPSMSEGISRAMLETQFLGLSTIIRDTDNNSSYISEKNYGATFNNDAELGSIMERFCINNVKRQGYSLMPNKFSADKIAKEFADFCYSI